MKALLAKLRGYRTYVFNAMIGGGSSLLLLLDEVKQLDLAALVNPQLIPYIGIAISAVGIWLRVVTMGPAYGRRQRYDDEYQRDDEDYGQRRTPPDARPSRRQSRHSVEPTLD